MLLGVSMLPSDSLISKLGMLGMAVSVSMSESAYEESVDGVNQFYFSMHFCFCLSGVYLILIDGNLRGFAAFICSFKISSLMT